jgi:tetratricopeptide (TPR) repeat protein
LSQPDLGAETPDTVILTIRAGVIRLVVMVLVAIPSHGWTDLPSPAAGELATIDPLFDAEATRIGFLVDVGRYEEAWALCDSLTRAHPGHPAPHLFTAGAYVSWMQSYRLSDYEAQVDESVARAIEVGTQLQETSEDAWLSSQIGCAYSYRAMARFRRHNWIGAYLDGRRSINYMKAALELDPQLYDAYFSLGGYHYWRTARSSFIRAVAFWMPDLRDLGLQQMELAVDHSRYVRHAALHGLALTLFDAGGIEAALNHNDQAMGVIDPPTNGSLYLRGRLMAQLQDWEAATMAFQQLLTKLPPRAIGYQVECKYWIARAHQAQGRLDEARQLVTAAMKQSESRNPAAEVESALESFDAIHRRLVELDTQLRDAH